MLEVEDNGSKGQHLKRRSVNYVMRALVGPPCPIPNLGAYAQTTRVTTEEFEKIARLWREATSSEAAFKGATARLPGEAQDSHEYAQLLKSVRQGGNQIPWVSSLEPYSKGGKRVPDSFELIVHIPGDGHAVVVAACKGGSPCAVVDLYDIVFD
ncbi:MAG: hypothetical protein U1E87_09885 [Alphaproteobacteria bacterium]